MSFGDWLGTVFRTAPAAPAEPAKQYVSVSDLPRASASLRSATSVRMGLNTGETFPGGFGPTTQVFHDYWTLRERSIELFKTNAYARGLVRRLITNEINTGLELGASPEEMMLGMQESALEDWSESVEQRFHVWSQQPRICDFKEQHRFGSLQAEMRRASFIGGDVLVVLRMDRRTGMPRVQLVDGRTILTPFSGTDGVGPDKLIRHGVEMDGDGRHVAYWVLQADGTHRRLPAYGARSGRRQAWLVYGTDHLLDEVRGQPLLSLFLQMLKEVDRYKDAALRKAVINSILAMFIKKDQEKIPSMPISGGATRRGEDSVLGEDGVERTFSVSDFIPGLVVEELNPGETPEAFGSQGTDEKFGEFEEAMLRVYAWSNEIPPEILLLSFSNNYSASQAAINEFKIYLNRIRTDIGQNFCAPIYQEWLLSQALRGDVAAPGLVDSYRARDWPRWGAWVQSEWAGHIKPSTDMLKQAKGYEMLIHHGWITNDLAARELTGTKFSKNIKKLRGENEMLAEANEPLNIDITPATNAPPVEPVEDVEEEEEEDVAAG